MDEFFYSYTSCIFFAVTYVLLVGAFPGLLVEPLINILDPYLPSDIVSEILPLILGLLFGFIISALVKAEFDSILHEYLCIIFSFALIILFSFVLGDVAKLSMFSIVISFVASLVTCILTDIGLTF